MVSKMYSEACGVEPEPEAEACGVEPEPEAEVGGVEPESEAEAEPEPGAASLLVLAPVFDL